MIFILINLNCSQMKKLNYVKKYKEKNKKIFIYGINKSKIIIKIIIKNITNDKLFNFQRLIYRFNEKTKIENLNEIKF